MSEWIIPLLTVAVNLFIAVLSRREIRANADKIDAERQQIKQGLEDRATQKNLELFDRLQKEREDFEKIREADKLEHENAIKRISKELIDFQTNLRNKESREVLLLNDLERYKQMKSSDDARLGELEMKLAKHGDRIDEIVRKTAPLAEREDLKKK